MKGTKEECERRVQRGMRKKSPQLIEYEADWKTRTQKIPEPCEVEPEKEKLLKLDYHSVSTKRTSNIASTEIVITGGTFIKAITRP